MVGKVERSLWVEEREVEDDGGDDGRVVDRMGEIEKVDLDEVRGTKNCGVAEEEEVVERCFEGK